MASDKPDPEVKSTPPANPIPILYRSQRRRPSSFDDFSDATSSDESSPIEPHTPGSSKPPFIGSASPSSSPILSALLGQSPSKSFPFNRTFQPKEAPADGTHHAALTLMLRLTFPSENEEYPEPLFQRSPVSHTRRATLTGLLSQQPQPSPDGKRDKGSAILRRLSMGGMFARVRIGLGTRPPSLTGASAPG